jgi:lipopolysaccharide/colanic/teichoic acid biosynthesis glycosyltransferase
VSAALSIAVVVILFAVAIAFAMLKTLLTDEARAWLPHIARALARAAGRRLPVEHRKRYKEEWLAEIEAYSDRPLSAVVRAVWLRLHARDMARTLSEQRAVPVLDRVVAGVALVLLAPLLVMIAIAIKCASRGPARVAVRRSFGGRSFRLLKFRTLREDAQSIFQFKYAVPIEWWRLGYAVRSNARGPDWSRLRVRSNARGPDWSRLRVRNNARGPDWPAPGESWPATTKVAFVWRTLWARHGDEDWFRRRSDPRLTRVARALRWTALDWLPMLVNIARGDMPLPLPWRSDV